ncbi:MAG TPA: hypothetical protein VJZ72_07595 [Candidatus Limnocylindrales bacterium]|nr:hypothetical protein [Candidatus Limnocylindrales bacterium]
MTVSPDAPVRPVPGGLPSRRIAEALFSGDTIHYVDRFDEMADLLDSFDDQRPATCGAYVARYLLPPLGFDRHEGVPTTREDYLALLAGTVIEGYEEAPAEAVRREASRLGLTDETAAARYGGAYYAWPLRASDDPAVAGTSPTGTARIIATVSGGALVTLPVPARDVSGRVLMTEAAWDGLLDLLVDRLDAWSLHAIVNYQSDQLLDPTASAYDAVGLRSADPTAAIPLDRWGVGHFAGIGALWQAADGRRWALLLDTYWDRGFSRYEPQPAELVRRALVRDDGREGGLLLVLPRQHLDVARDAMEPLGLENRMWGNGSPEPEGWAWEYGR